MKRLSIFLLASILSITSCAQTGIWNNLRVHNNFWLDGRNVNGISNDSSMVNSDSSKLITEWAVKNYVDNKVTSFTFATGQTYIVSSQDSMLNLDAHVGDVTIIPDSSSSYILRELPATSLSDWTLILTPASVPSVFGRTGNVTAESGDYTITQIGGVPNWLTKVYGAYGLINKSDSALMVDSTLFATAYQNSLKLNKGDTSGMLSNYFQTIDTTGKWLPVGTVIPSAEDSLAYRSAAQIDSSSFTLNKIGSNPGTVVKLVNLNNGSSGSSTPYTLPEATSSVLGGIKTGVGLYTSSGVLNLSPSSYTIYVVVNPNPASPSRTIISYDASSFNGSGGISAFGDSLTVQIFANYPGDISNTGNYVVEILNRNKPETFYSFTLATNNIINIYMKDATGAFTYDSDPIYIRVTKIH